MSVPVLGLESHDWLPPFMHNPSAHIATQGRTPRRSGATPAATRLGQPSHNPAAAANSPKTSQPLRPRSQYLSSASRSCPADVWGGVASFVSELFISRSSSVTTGAAVHRC